MENSKKITVGEFSYLFYLPDFFDGQKIMSGSFKDMDALTEIAPKYIYVKKKEDQGESVPLNNFFYNVEDSERVVYAIASWSKWFASSQNLEDSERSEWTKIVGEL